MSDRLQMVNREEKLSIRCQCDLVSVTRGSFYYQPLGETEENLKVMRLMDEHYLRRPAEGVPLWLIMNINKIDITYAFQLN